MKYKEFTTEVILIFVANPMMNSSQVELIVIIIYIKINISKNYIYYVKNT